MLQKYTVSAVSYLNTAPFIYGLQSSSIIDKIELALDYPAECARKLISGESEVGLVPAISLLNNSKLETITDFCIGASKEVVSVMIFSNSPLHEVRTIYLDYQSRTSVALVKILATEAWRMEFNWQPFNEGKSYAELTDNEAVLAIGDKVFAIAPYFSHHIDLAREWIKLTGLPMVFAVWATRVKLNDDFVKDFNQALGHGVANIPDAVGSFKQTFLSPKMAEEYLTQNISYNFDASKKKGLSLFLEYASKI